MPLVVERIEGPPKADEKAYVPWGAARELMRCRADECLVEGPSGTGKSRAVLEKLHLAAMTYGGMRGAMVRKTRESLTQTAMVTYETKVLPSPEAIPFHHDTQEYRYPNGSKIIVAGLDKASKIMSSEYDLIYVQEATELGEEEYQALLTRLRNNVMPYQQAIADCNPSGPDHWLNLRASSGAMMRLLSKHEDNPELYDREKGTWTPNGAAYIAKLDSLTGFTYKRLRLGLWVAAEGMFFTEWDEDRHVIPAFTIPDHWTRWVAIDYGFADPFCALWFARDPSNKRSLYIYRESYGTGLRDAQQARLILKLGAGERIVSYVADPSTFNQRKEQNKPSIASVYYGVGLRPLFPGNNKRIDGWQVFRNALAWQDEGREFEPRLRVLKGRAPNLVRTLPAMVHDPLDSEDVADKIKGRKTEDHPIDACRYGLLLEAQPEAQPVRSRDFRVVA